MGVFLSEVTRKKSSGLAETSGSALSVDRRVRSGNRDKNKNRRSKFISGKGISKLKGARCWRCSEMGHILEDCKQMIDGEGKCKEKNFAYITESDGSDFLIISLAEPIESWVIDSNISFHATSR